MKVVSRENGQNLVVLDDMEMRFIAEALEHKSCSNHDMSGNVKKCCEWEDCKLDDKNKCSEFAAEWKLS